MTGRRDVCSSHKPENSPCSPKVSILFGDTIKCTAPTSEEMILSKLQSDHSRESFVKSLINEKRRKKKKSKTHSVIAMSDLFPSVTRRKRTEFDPIREEIANIHSSSLL